MTTTLSRTATTIEPFTDEHLGEAADLLAARQRRNRIDDPRLPATLEDPERGRELLASELVDCNVDGVVALRGGQVCGYVLGRRIVVGPTELYAMFLQPRSVRIAAHDHLAVGPDASTTIGRLYAALAGNWVSAGYFSHYVGTILSDEEGWRPWFELGFGQYVVGRQRDLAAPFDPPVPEGIRIRTGGPGDVSEIARLAMEIPLHHTAAPIFLPCFSEPLPPARAALAEELADPAGVALALLAEQDGRSVGLVYMSTGAFSPVFFRSDAMCLPYGATDPAMRGNGIGRALVAEALNWARERGHRVCLLHTLAGNIDGARFWTSCGFEPLDVLLVRNLDPRIAWARGS